jgi:hypothetical protein
MAMVPLPRDAGKVSGVVRCRKKPHTWQTFPASGQGANMPSQSRVAEQLPAVKRHFCRFHRLPAKGGAKFTHCPVVTHYLTCLPLWGGKAMPQGGGGTA